MSKRVVVGMSGGVDSSVAAYLLKSQGYDVIGVTMQVWEAGCSLQMEREGGCCGQSAVDDARRVCDVIGIPYYVMSFRDVFQKNVIDYFVNEYISGRTPNPCIACNRYVKWEALLKKAREIGADYIATGHYARILRLENGRYTIRNSVTAAKDQTYALYKLTQDQLAHTLMPVGDYYKEDVRKIAKEQGLPVAAKPDSEEICFVADDDYAGYLDRTAGAPYDVHMMIIEPDRYLEKFITDNTEFITVHYEACDDLAATIKHIKEAGAKAGVSIKPGTAPEVLDDFLADIDLILVMSVEPGFGGQKFMDSCLPKIEYYKNKREQCGYDYVIEVDGGVGSANAHLVRDAGIDIIVAGSAVFKAADRTAEVAAIKG